MNPDERKRLRQEFDQLSELLDFHVQYDSKLSMSAKEHEAYRDKILDLMAALLRKLNELE
jgi:hypothetical protein